MRQSLLKVFVLAVLGWAAAAHGQTVPIVVDAFLPDARPGAPVTFGVPFPRGTLLPADAQHVRLIDDAGAVVPHQQAVTATWNSGGSDGVRWLLVDMQVNAGKRYALVVDRAKPQAA